MNDNCWIQTYTGKQFHILSPKESDIDIVDVAHALSLICRFNGHITKFYSVAEHSCYVAALCNKGNKLAGLMHDASEAYVGDVVSPLKGVLPNYKEIEDNLMGVLAKKFDFQYPLPEDVHINDKRQLYTEARHLLKVKPTWIPEWRVGDKSGLKPYGMDSNRAQRLFLSWFNEYTMRGEH